MTEVSRPRSRLRCVLTGLAGLVILVVAVPAYHWLRSAWSTVGPCPLDLSVPLESRPYPNGSVVDRGDVYPPGYHFHLNGTTRGCLCRLQPCIRKCCGPNEYLANNNGSTRCETNENPSLFDNFTLPVYKSPTQRANISRGHFRILYGDVCALGKFLLTAQDVHYLLDDGSVLLPSSAALDPTDYCLETLAGQEVIRTFVCFPPEDDDGVGEMFTFYPIGMILSMPFLVATFATYAVIPDLRNLHGLSLMCHVFSLLTAYVALTAVQLCRDVSVTLCVILAYIIQFSFLATFFWLNIMCFDIWWVFSGLRPMRGSSARESEHKKFVLYSLYAWGGPLLILGVSMAMDLLPYIPDSYIKPNFGVNSCWFKDSNALIVYFYLPIGMLVLLNILMFLTTALQLRTHTKETNKVLTKDSESRRTDQADRQRLGLYLKLFIVMGINWVMELVSFALGGPKYIWYVTDLGNTLQGVLIFLIFVCKRRILRMLNQRLCPRLELVASASASSRSRVSTSRTTSSTLSRTVSCCPDGQLTPIAHVATEDSDTFL